MSIQFATKRLIDSVWTLGYEIIDGKVKIHSFDRENPIGYEKEKELPQVAIFENNERHIIKVAIADYQQFRQNFNDAKEYEVINPRYVFNYSR